MGLPPLTMYGCLISVDRLSEMRNFARSVNEEKKSAHIRPRIYFGSALSTTFSFSSVLPPSKYFHFWQPKK